MTIRRTLPVLMALTIGLCGCAKVEVVQVPKGADKISGEGVFYALPRTFARVTVKADKTVSKSAPFARYAPIFTPGSKPPCGSIAKCDTPGVVKTVTKFSLQKGTTFAPFGEPDPDEVYMVKFTGGGAIDQALSMTWTETGVLSSASASVTNRTTDIVVAGIKTAVSVGGKAAAGTSIAVAAPTEKACKPHTAPNDKWVIKILRTGTDPADKIEDDVLVANYCDLPAVGPDEDSRDDFNETTDATPLAQAVRAYRLRVAELVAQRTRLLTAADLNLVEPGGYIERIEKAIAEQTQALFLGSEATKTWELPFEVRTLKPATKVKILEFNGTGGVCPVAALLAPDAKPEPDGFNPKVPACDTAVEVAVSLFPATGQLFERVASNVKEGGGDRSFRYRLPAQVLGTVSDKTTNYGTAVFSVAQLGKVVSLPAQRKSKTLTYDLAMVEATGGLKTFKLGTTGGLDAATVDALAGAAGTGFDDRNARRKKDEEDATAAKTAADELTVLTRQHALLKMKDEICTLQKKYGLTCTVEP